MSKQYKLKKSFPTLPSDWEVGMILGQGDRGDFGDYSPCAGNYTAVYLSPQIVEKSKEYFEEVPVPVLSEKVKVGKMSCHEQGSMGYGDLKWTLQFRTNKHIHYDNAVKLCNVLESALNNDDNTFWTDELVREYANEFLHEKVNRLTPKGIDHFKQSKQSEPLPSDTVSKEWEIVSYIGNSTKMIYTLVNDEWCPPDGYVPFPNNKQGIEQSGCEIHSVKRLSDNEVFCVGEMVDNFKVKDEIVRLAIFGGNMICDFKKSSPCNISYIKKLPPKEKEVVTDNTVTNNNDVQVPLSFNEIIKAVGERIMKYDQEQLKKLIAEKLKK